MCESVSAVACVSVDSDRCTGSVRDVGCDCVGRAFEAVVCAGLGVAAGSVVLIGGLPVLVLGLAEPPGAIDFSAPGVLTGADTLAVGPDLPAAGAPPPWAARYAI